MRCKPDMKTFSHIGKTLSCMVFVYLVACSPATMVTGSWISPEKTDKKYNHIVVAALTGSTSAKAIVEDDFALALNERGIRATKSIDVFPPNFKDEDNTAREQLLQKIRGKDVDAILTLSLIDQETETRYVPGTYSYTPYPVYPYYGSFWGYYSFVYPRVYTPGYYVENKIYYIESNLYDAKTEKLVWSAQSQTYNPSDLRQFSKGFVRAIVKKMEKDGVLPEQPSRN